MTGGRRRGERGSGSVLLGMVISLAVLAAGGVGVLGVAVTARHRAAAAADLAALAAAGPIPADCLPARGVAAANGALVHSCQVLPDGSVVVETEVPLVLPGLGAGPSARGVARAARPIATSWFAPPTPR